jgi:hypothetical protein
LLRCFCRGEEPGFLLAVTIGINALRSGENVGFAEAGPQIAPVERVPVAFGEGGSCASCSFRCVPVSIGVAAGAFAGLVPFVLWGAGGLFLPVGVGRPLVAACVTLRYS